MLNGMDLMRFILMKSHLENKNYWDRDSNPIHSSESPSLPPIP